MSSFIVWDAIRTGDAYSVKKAGTIFSTHRLSANGLHTFSGSGLAQAQAVSVGSGPSGRTYLLQRSAKKANKVEMTDLGGSAGAAKKARKAIAGKHYRADQASAVAARVAAVCTAAKPAQAKQPKKSKA